MADGSQQQETRGLGPARPKLSWRIARELYAFTRDAAVGHADPAGFTGVGITHALRAGYDAVEFSLSALRKPGAKSAIQRTLQDTGIEVASLFATLKTGASEDELRQTTELARAACELGCRALTLATVSPPGAHEAGEVGRTIEVCGTLAEQLSPLGIDVCWHPHEEDFVNGAQRYQDILAQTTESGLYVCLDLGWLHYLGLSAESVIRYAPDRVKGMHVRDSLGGIWTQAIGEGNLPLTDALRAVLDRGTLKWMSVELWFERRTPVTRGLAENAAVSLAAVREAVHSVSRSA